MKSPAAIAPIEGAAYNNPSPIGPTASISFAKMGKRAIADEKKVLKKSSNIVDQIMVLDLTNASPSLIVSNEIFTASPSISPELLIIKRLKIIAIKDRALRP